MAISCVVGRSGVSGRACVWGVPVDRSDEGGVKPEEGLSGSVEARGPAVEGCGGGGGGGRDVVFLVGMDGLVACRVGMVSG